MRTIYTFEITNPKKRYYTLLANIFLLFAAGIYAFYRYMQQEGDPVYSLPGVYIIPIGLLLVILLRFIFILRRKDIAFTQLHFAIILTVCWAIQQQYFFAGVILFFGLFEYVVNRDTACIINEEGVRIKAIPLRRYKWAQLENVMIRDGIFTVDRKDNHIFQVDVSNEQLSFSEEEFNSYCREQLSK